MAESSPSLPLHDPERIVEAEGHNPTIGVFTCHPGVTAEQFLVRSQDVEVIIVIGYASGTTPDRLAPAIAQRIDESIPVIILSNNPGDEYGIVRLRYAAGQAALAAGAKLLQKVNVRHLDTVLEAINIAHAQGLRAQALAEAIDHQFAFQDGETIPLAEWETADGIAAEQKRARRFLVEQGFDGWALAVALEQWERGPQD